MWQQIPPVHLIPGMDTGMRYLHVPEEGEKKRGKATAGDGGYLCGKCGFPKKGHMCSGKMGVATQQGKQQREYMINLADHIGAQVMAGVPIEFITSAARHFASIKGYHFDDLDGLVSSTIATWKAKENLPDAADSATLAQSRHQAPLATDYLAEIAIDMIPIVSSTTPPPDANADAYITSDDHMGDSESLFHPPKDLVITTAANKCTGSSAMSMRDRDTARISDEACICGRDCQEHENVFMCESGDDKCQHWMHPACLGLTDDVYEQLDQHAKKFVKNELMGFVCPLCRPESFAEIIGTGERRIARYRVPFAPCYCSANFPNACDHNLNNESTFVRCTTEDCRNVFHSECAPHGVTKCKSCYQPSKRIKRRR
jgi:hypothetical protein